MAHLTQKLRYELLDLPIKAVCPEYPLLFRDQTVGAGITHSEPVTFHVVFNAFQTTASHYDELTNIP